MTTNTTQSAATLGFQDGRGLFPRRKPTPAMGLAVPSSFQPRASSLQNLIANPELESRLTYRKLSPLKSLIANILRLFISISLSACLLAPLKGDSFLQAPSSRNTHENTCRAQDPRRASRSAEPFGLPRPVQASQPRPAE